MADEQVPDEPPSPQPQQPPPAPPEAVSQTLAAARSTRVWHDPETGLYVSHCDPLDVCSQGETEEEAINNLNEAVQIFLSTCCEMGTLNDVLLECELIAAEESL